MEDTVVFMTRKVFISVSFSLLLAQVTFAEKLQMKIKSLKFKKNIIHNSYLIRQSFEGYRCKSDIAIFPWRVTWNWNLKIVSFTHFKLSINNNFAHFLFHFWILSFLISLSTPGSCEDYIDGFESKPTTKLTNRQTKVLIFL